MTEKNDSNIKNNYWQMIRGIAIIAVVIIHCRIVDPSIGGVLLCTSEHC